MIALGRRKTDTSDAVNACARMREGTARGLVADLIGAPVAELDASKTVLEASCSTRRHEALPRLEGRP